MANPLTDAAFVKLLTEGLAEVAQGAYNDIPEHRNEFYRNFQSTKPFENFYQVGDLGDIPKFNGILTTLGVDPGYETTIEPQEFGAKIQTERRFIDDEQYGVLAKIGSRLGSSANRTKEKASPWPFTRAFSTAFNTMTSEEGKPLCSSSHTTKTSGVDTSVGFDNAGTSALSKTSVAATRLLMRKFRTSIGNHIAIPDDLVLIVPETLADTANEIIGSQKDPDTANNTKNMNYDRFSVMPWILLDDVSETNWYMVSRELMKQNLVWIDRVLPEFEARWDFNTKMMEQSVYYRCGSGFIDWRWIYGHQVS